VVGNGVGAFRIPLEDCLPFAARSLTGLELDELHRVDIHILVPKAVTHRLVDGQGSWRIRVIFFCVYEATAKHECVFRMTPAIVPGWAVIGLGLAIELHAFNCDSFGVRRACTSLNGHALMVVNERHIGKLLRDRFVSSGNAVNLALVS
jgi:hypothetical protein